MVTVPPNNWHPRTSKTDSIHYRIQTVCNYLTTRFATKKHGGFNIYEDDKIIASTDTYVPNVDLSVKVNNQTEHVFGCNCYGDQVTYHTGKWEVYLEELFDKALEAKKIKDQEQLERYNQRQAERYRPASNQADKVFA